MMDLQREVWVVGMRFHGHHRFGEEDVLRLEGEEDNPTDPQAVKVMLQEEGTWKKVAYCTRADARSVRTLPRWETASLRLYKRCSNSVGFIATVEPETATTKSRSETATKSRSETLVIEALTESLGTLSLKPLLKSIPKGVRHARAQSIDTLSEGVLVDVKAMKEYTHYRVRKIMIEHEGKYYYSNLFLEQALLPFRIRPFQFRVGAFETVGGKKHRQVTVG